MQKSRIENAGNRNKGIKIIAISLLALISLRNLPAPGALVQEELPEVQHQHGPKIEPAEDRVHDCGLNLLEAAGKDGPHTDGLPDLYRKASLTKDVEFLEYLLSSIYVESRFNKLAVSSMEARGLMQMTEIAVKDAVVSCSSLKPLGDISKLHDSVTNVKYGSCYLKKLFTEMDGDWTRTLITYNGGYRALQQYDKENAINHETANYVLHVQRTLNTICRQKRTEIIPIAN